MVRKTLNNVTWLWYFFLLNNEWREVIKIKWSSRLRIDPHFKQYYGSSFQFSVFLLSSNKSFHWQYFDKFHNSRLVTSPRRRRYTCSHTSRCRWWDSEEGPEVSTWFKLFSSSRWFKQNCSLQAASCEVGDFLLDSGPGCRPLSLRTPSSRNMTPLRGEKMSQVMDMNAKSN